MSANSQTDEAKFTLYFSHSWDKEYVDLNLFVWEQIHSECDLMVDKPDELDAHPGYYINRLEELLRRSDLFFSVLPYQKKNVGLSPMLSHKDAGLRCSPWSLFEIRLAERANRPRFILYDSRTGFKPPEAAPDHAYYIKRVFAGGDALDNKRELVEEIRGWLKWANDSMRPGSYARDNSSLLLLPEQFPARDEVVEQLNAALVAAEYDPPVDLLESSGSDAELLRKLSSAALLVADVGSIEHLWLYCLAHAMFIPTIRLLQTSDGEPPKDDKFGWILERLPQVLKGHPGGYQYDTICWQKPQDLGEEVTARARAMFAESTKITSHDEGKRFFEGRRYGKHRVFISHNLSQTDRELINGIRKRLDDRSVNYFEYVSKNRSGEDWAIRLKAELDKATHFLLLLSNGYEQSPACVDEMNFALEKNAAVEKGEGGEKKVPIKFIPFMLSDRTRPHVALNEMHHQRLDSDPQTNAEAVAERVIEVLLGDAVS